MMKYKKDVHLGYKMTYMIVVQVIYTTIIMSRFVISVGSWT